MPRVAGLSRAAGRRRLEATGLPNLLWNARIDRAGRSLKVAAGEVPSGLYPALKRPRPDAHRNCRRLALDRRSYEPQPRSHASASGDGHPATGRPPRVLPAAPQGLAWQPFHLIGYCPFITLALGGHVDFHLCSTDLLRRQHSVTPAQSHVPWSSATTSIPDSMILAPSGDLPDSNTECQ